MTFKFTSGPTYLLFVLCIMVLAFIKDASFSTTAEVLLGAMVWYTGRRAYKEVKAGQVTMTRDAATNGQK